MLMSPSEHQVTTATSSVRALRAGHLLQASRASPRGGLAAPREGRLLRCRRRDQRGASSAGQAVAGELGVGPLGSSSLLFASQILCEATHNGLAQNWSPAVSC